MNYILHRQTIYVECMILNTYLFNIYVQNVINAFIWSLDNIRWESKIYKISKVQVKKFCISQDAILEKTPFRS